MEYLIRHFIRDFQNIEDHRVRAAYGRFSGLVGIVSNLLLAALKMMVGVLFGSLAITADAVNNLSDSGSSVVTLLGFKFAEKPADEEHPFGHERMEYLSGLVVSFVILVVGLQLLRQSFEKIFSPEVPQVTGLLIVVLLLSVAVKIWQSRFYRKMGTRIHSATLYATAADSRNDAIATAVILLGILLTRLTGFNLDGYLSMAVAVLVLLTGAKLVKETSDPLLGEAPSKELVDRIYHEIKAFPGILGVHDLTVHNYGPDHWFASVHCEVDARKDVLVSHDLIDNIERTVGPKLGIQLVIHMDPIIIDDPRTNELNRQVNDMVKAVEPQATIHDFRVVWGPTHSNLIFDVCVPFSCPLSESELISRINMGIKALSKKYYTVITIDRDYVPQGGAAEKEDAGRDT